VHPMPAGLLGVAPGGSASSGNGGDSGGGDGGAGGGGSGGGGRRGGGGGGGGGVSAPDSEADYEPAVMGAKGPIAANTEVHYGQTVWGGGRGVSAADTKVHYEHTVSTWRWHWVHVAAAARHRRADHMARLVIAANVAVMCVYHHGMGLHSSTFQLNTSRF